MTENPPVPSSHPRFPRRPLRPSLLPLLPMCLFLAACGGGGGTSAAGAVVVSGSVSDGPVIDAEVTAIDADGRTIANVRSDDTARYRLEVPAGTPYPLLLRATGGTDTVSGGPPDFLLESAVVESGITTANLNPFSTLAVAAAKTDPDGLTAAALGRARERLMAQWGFGLAQRLADPITTPVDAANAAAFVRGGEALAETVRRTQGLLASAGSALDANAIIATLGADLGDGVIDGQGAGADPRVAATANGAAAEVVLESARNALVVGGAVATDRLEEAIRLTAADAAAEVSLEREALRQAQKTLAALETVVPTGLAERLEPLVAATQEPITPESVAAVVGIEESQTLADALLQLSLADEAQLQRFNDRLREQLLAGEEEQNDGSTPEPGTERGESGPIGDTDGATPAPGTPIAGDRAPVVIRVNAGGSSYVDASGITWSADTGFSAGSAAEKPNDVAGTTDPTLYQSERWDPLDETEMEYRFDVPNGLYTVRLHFAEHSRVAFAPGARLFDVEIEDEVRLKSVDIYAAAGSYTALVKQVEVAVTDAQMNIRFLHQVQHPLVNAIEILERRDFPTIAIDASGSVAVEAGPVALRVPLQTGESLAVSGDPAHGQALLIAPDTILYLPEGNFAGEDTLTYRITNSAGNMNIANIAVDVRCSGCQDGPTVELSWEPNSDEVVGYRIYAGDNAQAVTRQVSEVRVGDEGFDPRTPAVSLTFQELELESDEPICFRVKAFNQAGESAFSDAICSDT